MITALFADSRGEIFDAPGIEALARIGDRIVKLSPEDLIPLPETADLMYLPNRRAIGLKNGKRIELKGRAVSAILPVGFTRTHLPAFKREKNSEMLPLFGYTSVVLYRDELHVAAIRTDENRKWNPDFYNTRSLRKLISRVKKDLPKNRLIDHLANCSLEWHCLTAQNIFYRRWECGIPTSPKCNANCLGCISLQPAECCPSPQSRIEFKPTPEEIAELGIYHLSTAEDGIVSFGQGCEGEPSIAFKNISAGIKKIRESTSRGQINMNSNAGFTLGVQKIIDAGLDSIRVSIISAREETYQKYYRSNYSLANVKDSIRYALDHGVYVSLNLLHFPGFNDRPEEIDAWLKFLEELPIQMIQIRNLNLDPDVFLETIGHSEKFLGTKKFIETLQKNFPKIQLGNFSHFTRNSI